MYYYSSYFKLLSVERKETDSFYRVEVNENTLKILSLIFEFKIATSTHISRFFGKVDRDKHIYAKLRRMWQGHLLESFKVCEGGNIAMPVYYTLSKDALKLLERKGRYDNWHIRKYPKKDIYLAPNFFKHECMIVELASLESRVSDERLKVSFKGEVSSSVHDRRYDSIRDYSIEVFTPDYVAEYFLDNKKIAVAYTEYERTPKSKDNIIKKLERYLLHIHWEDRQKYILRIIFETEVMERAFWKKIIVYYSLVTPDVQNLLVMTTNLSLITQGQDFREPIYASRVSIRSSSTNPQKLEIRNRMKLGYYGKD